MDDESIFEVDLTDVYNYRFSYGGQSPYFHGLARGCLVAGRCTSCGFTWLPMRNVCSHCYGETSRVECSGEGEILTGLALPSLPDHAARWPGARIGSALVRVDGTDTCIKAIVVSADGRFAKGTRVKAHFAPEIRTIADFWFVTV